MSLLSKVLYKRKDLFRIGAILMILGIILIFMQGTSVLEEVKIMMQG